MANPTAFAKRVPGAPNARGTAMEGEHLSDETDEDESLSPSGQDSPHAKGGKANPLRMWAMSMLKGAAIGATGLALAKRFLGK